MKIPIRTFFHILLLHHIFVKTFTLVLFAAGPAVLPELTHPGSLSVGKKHIYITQGAEIFVYSRPGFRFVKKFGRAGDGPGEFPMVHPRRSVSVRVQGDRLVVNSLNRVSFFTPSGTFIEEIKGKSMTGGYMPVGDKYAATAPKVEKGEMFYALNLYDAGLNVIKELKRVKAPIRASGGYQLFRQSLRFITIGECIFILSSNQFAVDVVDVRGQVLFTIKRDYKRVKIDDAFKKNFEDRMKNNPVSRAFYNKIKGNITYPDYFPAVANIYSSGKYIYLSTYKRKGDNFEFFIYDIKGKFIERTFIRLEMKGPLVPYPAAISGDRVFQLVENENEEWMLLSRIVK